MLIQRTLSFVTAIPVLSSEVHLEEIGETLTSGEGHAEGFSGI
jgi:hypothetical protein